MTGAVIPTEVMVVIQRRLRDGALDRAQEIILKVLKPFTAEARSDLPLTQEIQQLVELWAQIIKSPEDVTVMIHWLQKLLSEHKAESKTGIFGNLLRILFSCTFRQGDSAQLDQVIQLGYSLAPLEDSYRSSWLKFQHPLFCEAGHSVHEVYYAVLSMLHEHVQAQGAQLVVVFNPHLALVRNLSDDEQIVLAAHASSDEYFMKLHQDIPHADENYRKQTMMPNSIQIDGIVAYPDYQSQYVNIINSRRIVCNQPESYDRTVYCIGTSRYNDRCEDHYTIPSHFQKILRDHALPVRVVDCSTGGNPMNNQAETVYRLALKRGDVVILEHYPRTVKYPEIESFCHLNGIPYVDLNYPFVERRYVGEMFLDRKHLNWRGNQEIATLLYRYIFSALGFLDFPAFGHLVRRFQTMNQGEFLTEDMDTTSSMTVRIAQAYAAIPKQSEGKIGAIVLNSNPFTKGHLHLVTLAAQIVDHLYIFVVEEDRSSFKFTDRFNMVQSACNFLPNVVVVPSGQFILSAETFPDYFRKEMVQEMTVDTSHDLDLFGRYVAKHFNISVRFVGEEPTDQVTRQYNAEMKVRLPQYGVQLIEIPRIKQGDAVISASRVRRLLAEKNWEEIRTLCPETTVRYLQRM